MFKLEPRLENISRFFQRLYEASHPIVKSDNALSKKIQKCLDEIITDIPARVSIVLDKEKNAMALPHGMIYINSGLLNLIEYEEELEFVLGHEYSHINMNKRALEKAKSLTEYIDSLRLEEYVSDLDSFVRMNQRGRNPEAGIKFLGKLGKGGGIAHGDTTHRVLNLYWMTRLMDLKGFELPLTRFNGNRDFAQGDIERQVPDVAVIKDAYKSDSESFAEIEKADLMGAIAIYQELLQHQDTFVGALNGSFDFRRAMINNKIRDYAQQVADNEGIGFALAELIRLFCVGDQNTNISGPRLTGDNFIDALKPEYFRDLQVIPIYEANDIEIVKSLEGQIDRKQIKKLKAGLETLLGKVSTGAVGELEFQKYASEDMEWKLMDARDDLKHMNPRILGLNPESAVRKLANIKNVLLAISESSGDLNIENNINKYIQRAVVNYCEKTYGEKESLAQEILMLRALNAFPHYLLFMSERNIEEEDIDI